MQAGQPLARDRQMADVQVNLPGRPGIDPCWGSFWPQANIDIGLDNKSYCNFTYQLHSANGLTNHMSRLGPQAKGWKAKPSNTKTEVTF